MKKGDRVELHPATDAWMQGDRYGTVERITRDQEKVVVLMDKSGRTLRFVPEMLTEVPK